MARTAKQILTDIRASVDKLYADKDRAAFDRRQRRLWDEAEKRRCSAKVSRMLMALAYGQEV